MSELRLDGKVAIITGAGRGLGRSYAELLAARGAFILVNDPGADLEGDGRDPSVANKIVDRIIANGGRAVANFDAVGGMAAARRIAEQALETFGRVDILINNAGNFLPPHALPEANAESFQKTFDVHVMGSIHLCQAVWPHMAAQRYGKILNVTSHVGYVGTRDRLEYGVAKGALHGFTRCLSHESLDSGIYVNAIAPGALTRPVFASSDNFSEKDREAFSADIIAPTALWLVHQDCSVNGEVFGAIAGTTSRIRFAETPGWRDDRPTPEDVRDHFSQIMGDDLVDTSAFEFPQHAEERSLELLSRYGSRSDR